MLNKNYIEIIFKNYENQNIYMKLMYKKQLGVISWNNYNIKNKINNIIYFDKIDLDKILDILNKIKVKQNNNIYDNEVVIINNYFNKLNKSIVINKYIPSNLYELSEVFMIIFNNLPRKYEPILYKLHAILTNTIEKYEYNKVINFDLFNDDISLLFHSKIIKTGQDFFNNKHILFLEKVEDKYIALIDGKRKYITTLTYDENKKTLLFNCSCNCSYCCKHLYAVILSIRYNKFNNFYKIDNDGKIMLSAGIVRNKFEIINSNLKLEYISINSCKILKNDDNLKLLKQINNIKGE